VFFNDVGEIQWLHRPSPLVPLGEDRRSSLRLTHKIRTAGLSPETRLQVAPSPIASLPLLPTPFGFLINGMRWTWLKLMSGLEFSKASMTQLGMLWIG
jgi:hypothetical protein